MRNASVMFEAISRRLGRSMPSRDWIFYLKNCHFLSLRAPPTLSMCVGSIGK